MYVTKVILFELKIFKANYMKRVKLMVATSSQTWNQKSKIGFQFCFEQVIPKVINLSEMSKRGRKTKHFLVSFSPIYRFLKLFTPTSGTYQRDKGKSTNLKEKTKETLASLRSAQHHNCHCFKKLYEYNIEGHQNQNNR